MLLAFASAMAVAEEPGRCTADESVKARTQELAKAQGEQVADAIGRIDGMGRQLLALRSYIRAARSIADRWSWTQAQIDAYRESDEYRALLAEIDKVSARFAKDNPGYTLYANSEVRSLDTQIRRWNENRGVGTIATDLYAAACKSAPAKSQDLNKLLLAWQPGFPSPLAAPGLSPHGRARAIDFQVQQGNKLIAGTSTAAIETEWVAGGWTKKLQAAVEASGAKFRGPLLSPNEPWHYEYRP